MACLRLVQVTEARHATAGGFLPYGTESIPLAAHLARGPLRPVAEAAILRDYVPASVAPSVAGLQLLEASGALLAAIRGPLQDMSRPQLGTFTTCCTAIAPGIPLIELTSFRSRYVATMCLLEMPLARNTTIHRLLRDLPQAIPLPNIFGRACTPVLPICQNAILRIIATHRTALCFEQRPITGVAALIVCLCNDTLPFTEAHTRRLVPVAPLREMAMSWNACRRAISHNRALESLQLGAHARRAPIPLEDVVRRFFL